MEKEKMFGNEDVNCGVGMGFFNPSMDQNDPFESALSSMVSSPTASSNTNAGGSGGGIVLRELIGRLGTICSSNTANSASCYTTPLNSPPKLNLHEFGLPPFSTTTTDPGFPDRAARFSSFATTNNNTTSLTHQMPPNLDPINSDSRENSSVSDQIPVMDNNSRKRKSVPKGKGKHIPTTNVVASDQNSGSSAKRSKSDEDDEKKAEDTNQKKESRKDENSEPPKDYIHVRARRGQATDAHSLAERVRREKISERMKVLQDLVPGCNKVTGKAVMLDEIINYVQSLQRQVEFLSMKLATVNPRMEFNAEALVSNKDIMFESRGSLPHNAYPSDASYLFQSQPNFSAPSFSPNHFNARNQTMPRPALDNFTESASQVLTSWEDDLHSVVQMGYSQNQTQNFHGILPTAQMKVEL